MWEMDWVVVVHEIDYAVDNPGTKIVGTNSSVNILSTCVCWERGSNL